MEHERYDRHVLIGLALTFITLSGLALAWTGEAARMEAATAEHQKKSVQRGRRFYVDNCTSCHGTRGEGIVGKVLNSKKLLETATDEVLFATIRAGRPGTTMPAWGQVNGGPLTDEGIHDVVAFLRAWEPTAPLVETDVFEPDAARGAALFASSCFICHGEEGGGTGLAPAINDPERLARLDNEWYRQTIANGRPAKGMPTWGTVLSPHQIDDILALIDAWRGGERPVPETTVAELLDSALFTLSQGDTEDALFYLERARPIAFGPALESFDPVVSLIRSDELNLALTTLGELRDLWPLGDAEAGAKIYSDACRGCHGAEGQGGVGRRLQPNELVRTSTNAELLNFLLTGRPGTAMRSFAGRLNEHQLADAIAHLRTWQDNPADG